MLYVSIEQVMVPPLVGSRSLDLPPSQARTEDAEGEALSLDSGLQFQPPKPKLASE